MKGSFKIDVLQLTLAACFDVFRRALYESPLKTCFAIQSTLWWSLHHLTALSHCLHCLFCNIAIWRSLRWLWYHSLFNLYCKTARLQSCAHRGRLMQSSLEILQWRWWTKITRKHWMKKAKVRLLHNQLNTLCAFEWVCSTFLSPLLSAPRAHRQMKLGYYPTWCMSFISFHSFVLKWPRVHAYAGVSFSLSVNFNESS